MGSHHELNELVGRLFEQMAGHDRAVAQLEVLERHAAGLSQAARKMKSLLLGIDPYGEAT